MCFCPQKSLQHPVNTTARRSRRLRPIQAAWHNVCNASACEAAQHGQRCINTRSPQPGMWRSIFSDRLFIPNDSKGSLI